MVAPSDRPTYIRLCWINEANAALDARGVSFDQFLTVSKKWLLDGLAFPHTAKLIAEAQSDGVSPAAICEQLGVAPKTPARWISGAFPPSLGNFVGLVLLVLHRDLRQVKFPDRATVLRDATRRTISQIRVELLGLGPAAGGLPTADEIFCVQRYVRDPLSEQEASDQPRLDRQLKQVLRERIRTRLVKYFPGTSIETDDQIQAVIDTWRVPYVSFELSLLPGWEIPHAE